MIDIGTSSERLNQEQCDLIVQTMTLFEKLRERSNGLTFDELVEVTGYSEVVVATALEIYVDCNLFRYDESDKRYKIGFRQLANLQKVMAVNDLLMVSLTEIYALRDKICEAAFFVIDDQSHATITSRALSNRAPERPFEALGLELSFHSSAAGKAMLADMDPERQEHIMAGDLHHITEKTIIEREALREELQQVRERGYATNDEESAAGVRAVAAAVHDADGNPVGSVTVAARSFRFKYSRLEALADDVMESAARITKLLQRKDLTPVKPVDPIQTTVNRSGENLYPHWVGSYNAFAWMDVENGTLCVGNGLHSVEERLKLPPKCEALAIAAHGVPLAFSDNLMTNLSTGKSALLPGAVEAVVPGENGSVWCLLAEDHQNLLISIDSSGMVTNHARFPMGASRITFCSTFQRVYASSSEQAALFAYDIESKRLMQVAQFSKALGQPSAMAMDCDANLWLAFNDGWIVHQLSPAGEILQKVLLPVPDVTGMCIGGKSGRDLMITSRRSGLSQVELENAPLAGHVFVYENIC